MTTALPRTQEDILAKIEEIRKDDWLGTQIGDLVSALDFGNARAFLKEGVTEDQWSKDYTTVEGVKEHAKEYLSFAMGKAEDHRGISAGRSIDHFKAWAWLTGDERFIEAAESDQYENYGAPVLKAVAEAIDAKDVWEQNATPGLENMAMGMACSLDCDSGCGF